LLRSLHTALDPQGDGLQGLTGSGGVVIWGTGEHPAKGSPVKPTWHWHTGEWLTTTQVVCTPQDPGQGSRHLSLMQARLLGHSALMVHSGRQFGERPT
jgi:hypothetical protein